MAVLVLAADVLTKMLAVAKLKQGSPVELLGGLVYLSLTRNTGAAFNLGAGYTAVLAVVAVIVIIVIIRFARRLGSVPWALALGLVLGGAAGNLSDRLFRAPGPLRGGVVDFISLLGPYGHPWPIFNVADSCLVVGVIIAVLLELSGRRLDGGRTSRGRGGPADADGAGAVTGADEQSSPVGGPEHAEHDDPPPEGPSPGDGDTARTAAPGGGGS